jgi:rod shape-determining protein MreC
MRVVRTPGTYIYARSSAVRKTAEEYKQVRSLTEENARLRKEQTALLARLGYEESLARENTFLRASLKIPQRIGRPITEAGVFMEYISASGYQTLINKGTSQGIGVGDIVATSEGVLIGKIQEVFPAYARVQLVSDPSLEIAAQVLGKTTRGIAQGNLDQGMSLNLIVQEESVTEGDTIISSGHDTYPAGLILGRIGHVDSNESEVFKKIRIDSANASSLLGPVIILNQHE